MMDYPTEQRIAGVAAPVLVLRGANDPVASADWCRRLAARAATGGLAEIQGTGHVVQHNRSAEVAEAILAFAGTPRRRPAGPRRESGMSGVLQAPAGGSRTTCTPRAGRSSAPLRGPGRRSSSAAPAGPSS